MRVKGVVGISAALLLGLTACSGGSAPGNAGDESAPASGASSQTSAAPQPDKPVVADYTAEELAAVVAELKDAQGTPLTVVPQADIEAQQEQIKGLMETMVVEPAACLDLAAGNTVPEGVTAALGTAIATEPPGMSAVSLASGLDEGVMRSQMDDLAPLSACADMTITVGGITGTSHIEAVDGGSTLPGTRTYRADTQMGENKTSIITSQTIYRGVLINVVAGGEGTEDEFVQRAADLMDEAVALLE